MAFLNKSVRYYIEGQSCGFVFFPPKSPSRQILYNHTHSLTDFIHVCSHAHALASTKSVCSGQGHLCDTEDKRQWLLHPHHIPEVVLGRQQTSLGLLCMPFMS